MQENIMKEVGKLQTDYQNLINSGKLTKKAICDLVCPFRDKYGLKDLQALQIARSELGIAEISYLLFKED